MNAPRPKFNEADFHTSSFSQPNQNCVAAAVGEDWVELRDSKTVFGSAQDGRLIVSKTCFDAFRRTLAAQTGISAV